MVVRRLVDERAFASWSMCLRNVSAHVVAAFDLLDTFRVNAV